MTSLIIIPYILKTFFHQRNFLTMKNIRANKTMNCNNIRCFFESQKIFEMAKAIKTFFNIRNVDYIMSLHQQQESNSFLCLHFCHKKKREKVDNFISSARICVLFLILLLFKLMAYVLFVNIFCAY